MKNLMGKKGENLIFMNLSAVFCKTGINEGQHLVLKDKVKTVNNSFKHKL